MQSRPYYRGINNAEHEESADKTAIHQKFLIIVRTSHPSLDTFQPVFTFRDVKLI